MTHNQQTGQTTLDDGTRALWSLAEATPRVWFVDDPHSTAPARRWPDEQLPDVRPGHITFGPQVYPSVPEAREMLPEYAALWDAVERDIRAARPIPHSREHADFFTVAV